jgi:hypothetical protein
MAHEARNDSQELIKSFDAQFLRLHTRSRSLVSAVSFDQVYRNPAPSGARSFGEYVLRSAAVVEQTFGGITANLWDDPFEWTLPEHLSTVERFNEYLEEVESMRRRGFASFAADSDLLKHVLVPAGHTQRLLVLLTETLVKAADYQGRAVATLEVMHGPQIAYGVANVE